ncbi:RDD family protein [Actinomadura sp. NPDC000600]|uniref:RDD family protein n=1 Tax=Actinomadura sp. NPDC000600 TaxID=3154262 RepID=UPI0033998EEB
MASTRQRVAARAIDLLVAFLMVLAAVSPVYAVVLLSDGSSSAATAWAAAPLVITGMAGPPLLRVGGIVRWGCTLGQRVAGIRVVREEDGTRAPGWRRSFRRYVLPRSASPVPLISDPWVYRKDDRLRQCLHDRRAGTVVVRAQAPPAPKETGGLAALGSPSPAGLPDHVHRWEARERKRRIALGSSLGVLGAAVLSAPFAAVLMTGPSAVSGPAFEVETFYDDATRFENRFGGRSETYERTAAEVLDDEEGCLAGATSEQARAVLRRTGCEGRIEIAFRTTDGVLVSSHVLKFHDRASAAGAQRLLRHTDLRFVPGGRVDPPGGALIGQVGTRDRYLVATTAVSARRPEAAAKAKNAFLLIHVPTLNVILWL